MDEFHSISHGVCSVLNIPRIIVQQFLSSHPFIDGKEFLKNISIVGTCHVCILVLSLLQWKYFYSIGEISKRTECLFNA
jgi:hypothetical protein